MHPILAIRAFLLVLFGRPLPLEMFPEAMRPSLPSGAQRSDAPSEPQRPSPPAERTPPPIAASMEPVSTPAVSPTPPPAQAGPEPEAIAVRTLSIFQSEGRLIDFLREDIETYGDADIGAAVREVHRGCRRALDDHFKLVPVRTEDEESDVLVVEGFDPAELRLVGQVQGKPPFSGRLKHRGWRAESVRLPQVLGGKGSRIVAPAEVEL